MFTLLPSLALPPLLSVAWMALKASRLLQVLLLLLPLLLLLLLLL